MQPDNDGDEDEEYAIDFLLVFFLFLRFFLDSETDKKNMRK